MNDFAVNRRVSIWVRLGCTVLYLWVIVALAFGIVELALKGPGSTSFFMIFLFITLGAALFGIIGLLAYAIFSLWRKHG